MAETVLRAPFALCRYGDNLGRRSISAISVALSEPARSTVRYRVRVDAVFSGGIARVGQIATVAPNSEGIPSRVVLIACVPGVLEWLVKATPIRPYDASAVAGTLKVDGWDESGTSAGITPLDGSILEAGGPDAGIYNEAGGLGAGVVQVPAGARVDEISALANSVGNATIAILSPDLGALPTITVPTSSGFTTAPKNLIGPATITFAANVLSHFVSWREVA